MHRARFSRAIAGGRRAGAAYHLGTGLLGDGELLAVVRGREGGDLGGGAHAHGSSEGLALDGAGEGTEKASGRHRWPCSSALEGICVNRRRAGGGGVAGCASAGVSGGGTRTIESNWVETGDGVGMEFRVCAETQSALSDVVVLSFERGTSRGSCARPERVWRYPHSFNAPQPATPSQRKMRERILASLII